MFRYVALIWNDAEPERRGGASVLSERLLAASSGWHCVLRRDGLMVLCRDVRPGSSQPHLLHEDAGVVLGKLFVRGNDGASSPASVSLDENETRGILHTAGRRLIDRYWGRYVAFLRDAASGTTWVLRDPTSALPCFSAHILGVDVYFSHMEEGVLLGGRAFFSINWNYVAASLCQNRLQVRATGLNEVAQVLGGECVTTLRGQSSRQFYWNALEVAAKNPMENSQEAAQLLRAQTRDCVQAWASGYPNIVLLLSGGLDSSIVLSCLRDSLTSSRLTCLNFHSPGSNTDERDYARLAASGMDCEVIERRRDSALTLEPLLQIRPSCIPGDNFFYLDGGRAESQLAAEKGASAVFSGYGGDQIFYQARARYAAADYLFAHGISPSLFGVALDAARVDRMSVWGVLREAVSHGLLGRRWKLRDEVGDHRPLVRPEVVRDISRDESLTHPWLHAGSLKSEGLNPQVLNSQGLNPAARLSSGKLWHAYHLLFPMEFYNPLGADGDPEPVTPLFSQPLLELVLRIPTWLLTMGGWDRALARRAFQHDVPRQIVTRRTKGGQEEHAKSILVRNLGFARDLLAQGKLVREGILDGARVAEVLSGRPTRTATSNVELFACLSVEAWLRQWQPA